MALIQVRLVEGQVPQEIVVSKAQTSSQVRSSEVKVYQAQIFDQLRSQEVKSPL